MAVTVVEARDRPGGRVWTTRFANGRAGELGGEFIDDAEHHELRDLARELGLELVRVVRSAYLDPASIPRGVRSCRAARGGSSSPANTRANAGRGT